MKILGFAGSNSSHSINKQLVSLTLDYFGDQEITFLDLNDFEMPIYSKDREEKGFPEPAHRFRNLITSHDAIVVSLAENNRTYSVAFKNVLDWCSRIDNNVFQKKPMLLMSTSPGKFGGGNVMKVALSYFPEAGADIVASFSLPSFNINFDADQGITHPELKTEHEQKIRAFKDRLGI